MAPSPCPSWGRTRIRCPRPPGAYVLLWETADPPVFLARSPASGFKGTDPTVPLKRPQQEWGEGASLLYVGSSQNLRDRMVELTGFSQAGPSRSVRHRGGRLLWQVEGSQGFLVAWKVTDTRKGEGHPPAHHGTKALTSSATPAASSRRRPIPVKTGRAPGAVSATAPRHIWQRGR
jgi:hypothetical protein